LDSNFNVIIHGEFSSWHTLSYVNILLFISGFFGQVYNKPFEGTAQVRIGIPFTGDEMRFKNFG